MKYTLNLIDVENSAYADSVVYLSAFSISLLQSAISPLKTRNSWDIDGVELSDVDWDTLEAKIAETESNLMSSLSGTIIPVITSAVPDGTLLCDGSIHNKSDYPALYEAMDVQFQISATQFRLPDLTDKFLYGSATIGNTGGSENHTLTVAELPAHTHTATQPGVGVVTAGPGAPVPVATPTFVPTPTSSVGLSQAHNNMPPYFTVKYVVFI